MKRIKAWGERERWIVAALFVGGLLAGGCSSDHLLGDVGTGGQAGGVGGQAGDGGRGGQGGGVGGQAGDGGRGGQAGNAIGGQTQSWTGYIENYQSTGAPTDVVKLSFATDPSGAVGGTLTFGNAAAPPPATDPNVGYPPALPSMPLGTPYIAQGFPYTVTDGSLVGQRLQFNLRTTELWTGWCGLQTPPSDNSGLCVPNWELTTDANFTNCALINPATNQQVSINCGKAFLCIGVSSVCTCSAATCSPDPTKGLVSFDITLAGTTASGSIAEDIRGNVQLTKDP